MLRRHLVGLIIAERTIATIRVQRAVRGEPYVLRLLLLVPAFVPILLVERIVARLHRQNVTLAEIVVSQVYLVQGIIVAQTVVEGIAEQLPVGAVFTGYAAVPLLAYQASALGIKLRRIL